MAYQACRWYDEHPKLAFAIKLLYLAPQAVQDQAYDHLEQFLALQHGMMIIPPVSGPLEEALTEPLTEESVEDGIALDNRQRQSQRWYDRASKAAQIMTIIQQGPNTLKDQVADQLLALFD